MRCLLCRWIFHPHRPHHSHPPHCCHYPHHPHDKHDVGCKVEEPAQEVEPADLQLAYVSLSGDHLGSSGGRDDH